MEQERKNYVSETVAPIVSLGKWIGTLLLVMIPLVNLILIIVWSLSKSENPNRRNWAQAILILWVVLTVIYVVLFLVFGDSFKELMQKSYQLQ
ncbi:MAG: hypothetical protein K0B87_07550 [Candidatus Syntrophosphaera sp.]|nr:hypothetical protein [Candidatus Syntrophosphaera sp.]